MTMQTKPLSPSRTTSYPDAVNTLILAGCERCRGAALRASATSAARGIRYSESGGYFEFSAQATDGPISEASQAVSNISVMFPMCVSLSADFIPRNAVQESAFQMFCAWSQQRRA